MQSYHVSIKIYSNYLEQLVADHSVEMKVKSCGKVNDIIRKHFSKQIYSDTKIKGT